MAQHDLNVFDMATISTSNPSGFNSAGGEQFWLGWDTITISEGARSDVVVMEDDGDFFDDDDIDQRVAYDQVVHGYDVPGGTLLEAEYELFVRDSWGRVYTIQLISVNGDPSTIYGYSIVGDPPPFGEPLIIVGRADGLHGFYRYSDSAAVACFTAGTRIATATGHAPAETLRPGARLRLADGGLATLRLVLTQQARPGPEARAAPIRLQKNALGPGRPARRLVLSPQHRVHMPDLGGLVPAKALTALPRIGPLRDGRAQLYIHLVLDRHAILLAEGLPCESFWPGAQAMKALAPQERRRVRAIMGTRPEPALPLIRVQEARRQLAALSALPKMRSPSKIGTRSLGRGDSTNVRERKIAASRISPNPGDAHISTSVSANRI
ncbi:Hint domain-containing protein [Ferrimonas balearica]|nr:Hint domain-containing protein [Ferrimonas balearica]